MATSEFFVTTPSLPSAATARVFLMAVQGGQDKEKVMQPRPVKLAAVIAALVAGTALGTGAAAAGPRTGSDRIVITDNPDVLWCQLKTGTNTTSSDC